MLRKLLFVKILFTDHIVQKIFYLSTNEPTLSKNEPTNILLVYKWAY